MPASPVDWVGARQLPHGPVLRLRPRVGLLVQRRPHLGPVAGVTVLGAIVGIVVASATVWVIDMRLATSLLGQVEARAVDQVQLGVLDQLSAADFQPPHTPAKAADLAARLDPFVMRLRRADSGVIRVNLVAADGTILYSDAPHVRGTWMPPGQRRELATALRGSIGASARSSLSTEENADLRERYGEAFEVYVPVRLDGRVAGAYEIYVESGELRATLMAVWLLLAGSVGVLVHGLDRWAVARHAPWPGGQGTAPLTATPTVAVGYERMTRVIQRARGAARDLRP